MDLVRREYGDADKVRDGRSVPLAAGAAPRPPPRARKQRPSARHAAAAAVAAIVQPRAGHQAPSLEALQEHCRAHVAGYKVPRRLYVVDAVERAPSGKPDYTWAAAVVAAG